MHYAPAGVFEGMVSRYIPDAGVGTLWYGTQYPRPTFETRCRCCIFLLRSVTTFLYPVWIMSAGVFEGMVSRYSPDAKDSGGSSSQEDEETVVSDLQHALSGRGCGAGARYLLGDTYLRMRFSLVADEI
jgi:hypothetical protein